MTHARVDVTRGHLAAAILLATFASIGLDTGAAAQRPEPAGVWIGQYQTTRAFHGRLRIDVGRDDGSWTIEVVSANEHYPAEEPEMVDWFAVTPDALQWVLHWGPTEVAFYGEIRGDFIVGELEGSENGIPHFKGVWIAVREAGGRERPVLGR